MSFRTILVYCDAGPGTPARLKIAADLAARHAGHVIGLFVRQAFQAPAFTDAGPPMDSLYRSYETALKADEAMAMAAFRDVIGRSGEGGAGDWRSTDGLVEEVMMAEARYADLVILGQDGPDAPVTTAPSGLAEDVVLTGLRPVMIVPHIGVMKPPGSNVMLCWNESREAVRAATAALPLLERADKVTILLIDPRTRDGREPGADVAAWLGRHGVKATVQRDSMADSDVGAVILSRAADLDADLIVMGLYGHSRMREWVLGGASRTLLASMTVPVFVMH